MKMDNFTVVLDISKNMLQSTVFFISNVARSFESNIHVINYSNESIRDYFRIDESKTPEFIEDNKSIIDKLTFVDNPVKKVEWLTEYIEKLSVNDFVFLNGAEKLLEYKATKPVMKTKYLDLTTQMHFLREENWTKLAYDIDLICSRFQNSIKGLIVNISTDADSSKIIQEKLDESDSMSIIVVDTPNSNEEYEKLQKYLVKRISKMNLSESLEEIDKYKSQLGENTYLYFVAMSYYNHGDFTNSIKIMEHNYDKLLNETKLQLADMLIVTNNKNRAAEVLNQLYEEDKYMKDLFPAILRLYTKSDSYDEHIKWLEIALKIDPNNPAVIELNANRFVEEGENEIAAVEYRRLSKMLSRPYFELVARINDIIYDKKMTNNEIEKYINDFIILHPDLKNEAYYRLANYYINVKESYYLAYEFLNKCLIQHNESNLFEIVKLKLDILTDDKKASKALRNLKIYKKKTDADKLSTERVNALIQCIDILAAEQNGYLYWRGFIDQSQSHSIWEKELYFKLKEIVADIKTYDVNDYIEKSWINEIDRTDFDHDIGDDITKNPKEMLKSALMILRLIKTGDKELLSNFNNIDELIETMLVTSEYAGDNNFRIWCRYYLSIIASVNGKHQEANNLALSILEYYNRVDSELKNHCLYLGILAWGHSQYRLDRYSEGIACIIASSKYMKLTNEIYPFMEEAVNIIGRYLLDSVVNVPNTDFEIWTEFNNSFGSNNTAFKYIWESIYLKDTDHAEVLKSRIVSADYYDSNWAGHVVNLVAFYAKNKDFVSAVQYILRYYDKVIPALSSRMDIRHKVLLNWAHILFLKSKTLDDFFILSEILEHAENDIEEKRKVSHKEERASIGNAAEELYRFHIQICSILMELIDCPDYVKGAMVEKIEQILPKISPRSTIEQKDYHVSKKLTSEAKELKIQLGIKSQEYDSIFECNSDNVDLLSEKAEEIKLLTEKLKEIHPHYMELKNCSMPRLSEISNFLEDDEIFFQYIISPVCITNIIVTSTEVMLIPSLINAKQHDINKMVIEFGNQIQSNSNFGDNKEIINLSENISSVVANVLYNYLDKTKISRIYHMPDFKIGMFPLASVNISNKYLIDLVDSIINVLDYRVLQNFNGNSLITKVSNRIFGNLNDPNLSKINRWLKKDQSETFRVIENDSDSFKNLETICEIDEMNTLAIYAHGLSEPKGKLIDGAKGLEGQKQIINVIDVIDKVGELDNLFLISCSGGSPEFNNVEKSNGTWASVLEMFSGTIIMCKWDVPTSPTIEIMNELFTLTMNHNIPIDKALIKAQRNMKSRTNLKAWSGLEFWVN